MKRTTLALIALLAASATATAAEPAARGFYVGANAGVTSFEDDGVFAGTNFDDSDTSYGLYGGYKFFKYLAVEARVASLGSYGVAAFSSNLDLDASVYSAHVVGMIPFGQSGWELFGQLGIGSLKIDIGTANDSTTVASGGIGIRFYPMPHLGIALQTDAYVWEEDGFGSTRDLGIGATQLAVHYLF